MVWNAAGTVAARPESVFWQDTQSLASRYLLGMNEGVQAEVNFYHTVCPTLGASRLRPCLRARHRFIASPHQALVVAASDAARSVLSKPRTRRHAGGVFQVRDFFPDHRDRRGRVSVATRRHKP